MRVGIIGRTHLLIQAAEEIIKNGHEIAFVYTCRSEAYYKAHESDFERFAKRIGCPYFNDLNVYSHLDKIKSFKADVSVSINWLTILRDPFLNLFRHGVLNAHAGDLPRYKGNACPNWAILNFEEKVALTIHQMTEQLDSGPYILKKFLEIDESTYIGDVYNWLDVAVPKAFCEALEILDTTEPIPQSIHIRSLRTYPRKPEDSRIHWTEPVKQIGALIRASSHPFSGAFCFLNDTDTKVLIYRASRHHADFDYLAIPGQVCFAIKENPVIAARDGLIEIQECEINGASMQESKKLILKSLRNRLI